IIVGFFNLRAALRIMQPGFNSAWLTAPGGQSLHLRFPIVRREIYVPDSTELYDWGLGMMDRTRAGSDVRQLTGFRNGLIIALFAARGPRIRALSEMRLERNLHRDQGGIRIVFREDNNKTPTYLEYGVSD